MESSDNQGMQPITVSKFRTGDSAISKTITNPAGIITSSPATGTPP